MSQIVDREFVQKIDWILAEQNVPLSVRPSKVAMQWQEATGMIVDLFHPVQNEIYDSVIEIYKQLYPNDNSFIGVLFGGIAINDRMYQVNIPILYGQVPINPLELIRIPQETLNFVFKNYPQQGWRAFYGVCDLFDLGYSIDDLITLESPSKNFLPNIKSNITAIAQVLLSQNDIDSVIQNTCVVAELSMKTVLLHLGCTQDELKNYSHNLKRLSQKLTDLKPTRNDEAFLAECSKFPNYVNSRYEPSGLNRQQIMSLAMRAQFVAAEAFRRITDRHMVWDFEMNPQIPARPFIE